MHATVLPRWGGFTLVEQLAHVGSEVERCFNAREGGRDDRLHHALDRALELFDATAADARWRGPKRREILRARELFCELVLATESMASETASQRRYYLAFAVAARRQRKV
jgi:hypothetical protein